jgi:hypothetical protein
MASTNSAELEDRCYTPLDIVKYCLQEFSPQRRREMEAHFVICSPCREKVVAVRVASDLDAFLLASGSANGQPRAVGLS